MCAFPAVTCGLTEYMRLAAIFHTVTHAFDAPTMVKIELDYLTGCRAMSGGVGMRG